ncbi:MAG: hypothetical protein IJJ19_03755 [Erysipelotrichaceae bacterium]|nr:hypothetical protein [Erysipelotrichaceae bacterium]
MKKINTRILINVFIAIIVPYAWLKMVFSSTDGVLVSTGLRSLRYFTILSNLLEGFASVVFLLNMKKEKPWVNLLKYVAAVSVGLTFLVVVVFLGPLFGYLFMFIGVNFWLHLIVPVLAMVEFVIYNREKYTVKDNLIASLPMVIYGIFYLGNIIINGVGQWPDSNDWYGFMSWGLPVGIVIFFVIVAVTYGIGLVLRKLNGKVSGNGN